MENMLQWAEATKHDLCGRIREQACERLLNEAADVIEQMIGAHRSIIAPTPEMLRAAYSAGGAGMGFHEFQGRYRAALSAMLASMGDDLG